VIAQHRAQRMRAVPADIGGGSAAVPGIEPVVIVGLVPGAAVAVGQFGVVALHAGIRLAHHDALPGDTQLLPNAVRADHGQIPLLLRGLFELALIGRHRRGQRAQDGTIEHPVHLGAGGKPQAHQRSGLHLDGVFEIIRLVSNPQAIERLAQFCLAGIGRLDQAVIDESTPGMVIAHLLRPGKISLLFEDDEQALAVQARLADKEVQAQANDRGQPGGAQSQR